MSVKLLTEHHLEFLSLKGGCTGSSESTLIKMSHCWKSHAAAHIKLSNKNSILVFVLRMWYHRSCVWLQGRNNVMVTSIYTLETAVNYT